MPEDIFHRCCEKAESLWKEWPKAFGLNDLKQYDIIGIEMEGWLELPNGKKVSIRIDLLVRDKSTGNIYIIDTKTTKNKAFNMLQDYFYKAQPRLYCAWLMEEKPEFRNHFRGWITDVASQRILKTGLVNEFVRSDPVFYNDEKINACLISTALLVDEIAEKVNEVVNNNSPINHHFICNYNNCRAYYRTCPYFESCDKIKYFGDNPGSKFKIDQWVEDRTVISNYLN